MKYKSLLAAVMTSALLPVAAHAEMYTVNLSVQSVQGYMVHYAPFKQTYTTAEGAGSCELTLSTQQLMAWNGPGYPPIVAPFVQVEKETLSGGVVNNMVVQSENVLAQINTKNNTATVNTGTMGCAIYPPISVPVPVLPVPTKPVPVPAQPIATNTGPVACNPALGQCPQATSTGPTQTTVSTPVPCYMVNGVCAQIATAPAQPAPVVKPIATNTGPVACNPALGQCPTY